jgi:hypothetical protein
MAKLVLARIDPETKKSPVAPKVDEPKVQSPNAQEPKAATSDTPPAELVTPETRHIPATVKRAVWVRDRGRCTYAGCQSRYALQFDHVIPYSHGGAHAVSNLRLLCRAHHQARAAGLSSSWRTPADTGSTAAAPSRARA